MYSIKLTTELLNVDEISYLFKKQRLTMMNGDNDDDLDNYDG